MSSIQAGLLFVLIVIIFTPVTAILAMLTLYNIEYKRYLIGVLCFIFCLFSLCILISLPSHLHSHYIRDYTITLIKENVYDDEDISNSLFSLKVVELRTVTQLQIQVPIPNNEPIGYITCFSGPPMLNNHIILSISFCGIQSQNENFNLIDVCNSRSIPYYRNINDCIIVGNVNRVN
jgi:hypothetical protein